MTDPVTTDAVAVLTHGDLQPEGRLVDASNTTLRCWATLDGVSVRCVYKPVAGERPLWDFPDGTLAGREVAAYLVSAYLESLDPAWALVPPTVHRDGPLGPGACQLWIEETDQPPVGFVPADAVPPGWHEIAAAEDTEGQPYVLAHADDPRLARMVIFDSVINNADRKGGHVLLGKDGHLYGVDHGVCFHVQPKLRTVLWGWAGTPLPAEAGPVLTALAAAVDGDLGAALAPHLSREEVAAVAQRARRLHQTGRFALPSRSWPAIPWPPI
ncbi:MAG TPA: SCO1664 family protein [Natronosporangium sp.]|nr:SCO1664 family protein [Natronosporangium sp.]